MKHTLLAAVLLTLTAFGSAAAQGCCAPTSPSTSAPVDAAMNTSVQLTYGKTLNLSAYRGQPLVLAIFSTTCPSCVTELKMLTQLQRAGTKVLLVSGQDSLPELSRFMRTQHLPFPVGRVAPEFIAGLRVLSYPAVFVLDPSGQVRDQAEGEAGSARLLAQLIKSKP